MANFDTYKCTPRYDKVTSRLKKDLMLNFEKALSHNNMTYLSVPITMDAGTFCLQPLDKPSLFVGGDLLSGSGEQGMIEYFQHNPCETPEDFYTITRCFRTEPRYEGWKYCREFEKIEIMSFCEEAVGEEKLDYLMAILGRFLNSYRFEWQSVIVTEESRKEDPSCIVQIDIVMNTKAYGELETHSITLHNLDYSKKLGISDSLCMISCTGLAFPRIMVQYIERFLDA
jgi:hypothetical protein